MAKKRRRAGLPRRRRPVTAGTAEPARRNRGRPVTGWTVPDRDILRRIIFQLQHPDWHLRPPGDGADGSGTPATAPPTWPRLLSGAHGRAGLVALHLTGGYRRRSCRWSAAGTTGIAGKPRFGPARRFGGIEPDAMQPQPGSVLPFRRRADAGTCG